MAFSSCVEKLIQSNNKNTEKLTISWDIILCLQTGLLRENYGQTIECPN